MRILFGLFFVVSCSSSVVTPVSATFADLGQRHLCDLPVTVVVSTNVRLELLESTFMAFDYWNKVADKELFGMGEILRPELKNFLPANAVFIDEVPTLKDEDACATTFAATLPDCIYFPRVDVALSCVEKYSRDEYTTVLRHEAG